MSVSEDFCNDLQMCPWAVAQGAGAGPVANMITTDLLTITCLRDWIGTGTGLCGRTVTAS